jgi:hypothetical protein
LLSPDSALLGCSEKINVPLAGRVSFFGFMPLGPVVLIMLRVYLRIYVKHSNRLDRLARSMQVVRAPTLVLLRNGLVQVFDEPAAAGEPVSYCPRDRGGKFLLVFC